MALGQELLNVPMGDMIRQMAFAIAEAQVQLDASSIEVAEMMGGLKVVRDDSGNPVFDDSRIFFGYEFMTVQEAAAYIQADLAMSRGDADALLEHLRRQSQLEDNAAADARIRVPTRMSMLELGFSPTFYQFVDTIIEVKIAIKITRTSEFTHTTRTTRRTNNNFARSGVVFAGIFGVARNQGNTVSTSQVDATYSNKYGYSAEGASLLRTKLAPIPPPQILEERVRRQMDEDAERRRAALEARNHG